MKRGRPFEPGNNFGRGRSRGSRNKRTLIAQQLLEEHAESILRKAMVKALQGDSHLLQALLPYILPRTKDAPVKTGMLRTGTAKELSQSFEVGRNAEAGAHYLQKWASLSRGIGI